MIFFKKNNKFKIANERKSEGGFSLVEIVLSASIISISLLAIISMSGQSIVFSKRALNTYTAATLLEEGAEAVRIYRDNGWSNISGLSNGVTYKPSFSTSTNTWSFPSGTASIGIFSRSVVFSNVTRDSGDNIASSGTTDTGTRLATVTVSWVESGTTITKNFAFYISNIF